MAEPRICQPSIRHSHHRFDQPAISSYYAAHNPPRTGLTQSLGGGRMSEDFGRCAPHPSYYEVEWSEPSTETESDSEASAQEPDYYWHHFYNEQRSNIQKLAAETFREWCTGVRYTAPPEGRLPFQNRTRTLHRRPSVTQTEEEDNVGDAGLVVIAHQNHLQGFFRLACPFYVYDPKRHYSCLKNSLRSIETVIDHLIRHHSRSPYCPICYKKFNTLIERDNHILSEMCKMRDSDPSDGLAEDQKILLIHENCPQLEEKLRWHRIWTVIFPEFREPCSPYLDEGCGLMASMANDFWDLYGHQIISDFLDHQHLTTEENDDAHTVLYDLTMDDLLNSVMREHMD
ncbi:Ff.00g108870.m01.CDS01 [Fusarium sp. VM40]|nr:Ff.00g108870.m01.CDS01 [Fusarium sp. VM40]